MTLSKSIDLAGNVVVDDMGRIVLSQRLSGGELVFLAKDVPPLGGRRYHLAKGNSKTTGDTSAQGTSLHNEAITVRLNPNSGAIASLRVSGIDHEFVQTRANLGLNGFVYLPGADVAEAQSNGPVTISVLENGPLVASLLVESDAPGCNKLRREVRLIQGSDRVILTDSIDKKAVRAVEGVHLGFDFNIADPAVRINIPWAVIQPDRDQLTGACKNWFCVEHWLDISNDRLGVTWATLEAPLVEIGGLTANLPRSQPDPKAYLSSIKPSAKIFSWVMNNHWHTNYRAEQEGPTVFHNGILPHAAYDQAAAARFGLEFAEPLIAAPALGPPPAPPPVEISDGPIVVSSIKPSLDGHALMLRLFNTSGTEARASLQWNAAKPKRFVISDLLEDCGRPIENPVQLAAYQVVTLRAELN